MALQEADARLIPAVRDDFMKQLTACLTLVAPTGMDEGDRKEWFRAAWGTLDGIPSDLLEAGCEVARETCDHPAKIVPAVMRIVSALWRKRRDDAARVRSILALPTAPPAVEPRCTPDEAARIIKEVGLQMPPEKGQRAFSGPPTAPTREDYIRWGVDPDALGDQAA